MSASVASANLPHANLPHASLPHGGLRAGCVQNRISGLDDATDGYAPTAPSYADGTLIDRSLHPADDREVVRQMAYVLRSWPGSRGRRRGDDALARMTAERLVDYLHLSGFELMKRPMATDTGYVGGEG